MNFRLICLFWQTYRPKTVSVDPLMTSFFQTAIWSISRRRTVIKMTFFGILKSKWFRNTSFLFKNTHLKIWPCVTPGAALTFFHRRRNVKKVGGGQPSSSPLLCCAGPLARGLTAFLLFCQKSGHMLSDSNSETRFGVLSSFHNFITPIGKDLHIFFSFP